MAAKADALMDGLCADPERLAAIASVVFPGFLPGDRDQATEDAGEEPELTGLHKAVLVAMALVFAFMIFSVVPWAGALTGKAEATPYGFELDWSLIVNLPLAFRISSTSGHTTLPMPILAPLADLAGVSRAVVVTAWQAASGWMNLWVPTTAVTIGGVALAKVGYDRHLRFVWPLLAILLILICAFVAVGAGTP